MVMMSLTVMLLVILKLFEKIMIMIITTIHSFVIWACELWKKKLLIHTTPVCSKKTGFRYKTIRVYIKTLPWQVGTWCFPTDPTQDPNGWRLDQPWKGNTHEVWHVIKSYLCKTAHYLLSICKKIYLFIYIFCIILNIFISMMKIIYYK